MGFLFLRVRLICEAKDMPKPTISAILARTQPEVTKSGICFRWLKAIGSTGYGHLTYSENGKARTVAPHRLLLELKLERSLRYDEWALHSCDNRWCCNPDHIRLGTASENQKESWDKGQSGLRARPGEMNGRATLTEEQVRAIRLSTLPVKEIAARFQLHWATVYGIRRRKLWKHVI